ncbi:hypothetical protein PR048_026394 [Dryococelus australis]|uniref:DUF4371 domain-containing protein n=1 Tax=Dryococelus australis TaxID=614101 RepID=A0ABQ9GL74_9NEOP|nr:hypothetical protein PR048_026394 [Dryococelus australis]
MAVAKMGVKSRMLAAQPLALYIHCAAHALNVALQGSFKSFPLIRNCLQWVNDIGVIVRDSPKRRAVSGPRPLCPTRWTVREAPLSGVFKLYPAVLDFLDTLAYDRSYNGPKARGFLNRISQGNIIQVVFSSTQNLSNTLQSKTQIVAGAKEAYNVAIQCLESKRLDIAFDGVWDEDEQKIKEMDLSKPTLSRTRTLPKRSEHAQNLAADHKFESVKQYYRKMYYGFLDNIINEIEDRCEQPGFEKYLHLAPGSLDEPILTNNI